MKKYITTLLITVACLSLASCKKELLTTSSKSSASENSLNTSTSNNKNEQTVPFKGEYIDAFEVLHAPPMFVQKVTGTGYATHLGNSTFVAITHVDRSTRPPFAVSGTRTFTAANGDQLFTTFTGLSIPVAPGTNKTELVDVVVGGTGRFLHASGSFNAHALADQSTSIFTASFDGHISY